MRVNQNALDCSSSLIDAKFVAPEPVPFNSAGSSVVVAKNYTVVFNHF